MEWDKVGTGIMSGLGSWLSNVGLNYVDFQQSKELAQQQNQFNYNMWNLQNEYNSPAAQMERLKAANLNPNLMYGNGNVVTGNASSSPEAVAPVRNPLPQLDILDHVYKLKNLEAQTENIDLQNDLLRSQRYKNIQDITLREPEEFFVRIISNILGGVDPETGQLTERYQKFVHFVESLIDEYLQEKPQELSGEFFTKTSERAARRANADALVEEANTRKAVAKKQAFNVETLGFDPNSNTPVGQLISFLMNILNNLFQ